MTTKTSANIKRPRRKRVTFRFEAEPNSDVRLAGSFNSWHPETCRLIRRNGNRSYSATMLLAPGRHEYKFVVNGDWHVDPSAPACIPNEHGTLNSVIHV
jgi:1,4-alpha-glucan branching enzyme